MHTNQAQTSVKPRTQYDSKVRVVAVENLRAMCARVSGCMCHKFWIESVSRSRVTVGYSNEDEWATPHPMFAVFPCYPGFDGKDAENPNVILEFLRVTNDNWDGEGWQAFDILRDCPPLWRNPNNGGKWQTREEIETDQAAAKAVQP